MRKRAKENIAKRRKSKRQTDRQNDRQTASTRAIDRDRYRTRGNETDKNKQTKTDRKTRNPRKETMTMRNRGGGQQPSHGPPTNWLEVEKKWKSAR